MNTKPFIFATALALIAWSLAAFQDEASTPTVSSTPEPARPAATTAWTAEVAPTVEAYAPIAALNAMDTRTPVPLQPMMAWHQKRNMQQHLVAIQLIIEALSREDWNAVAEAATMIESSPQMQQTCEHMGAGAEGFTELALDFHKRADAIGIASLAQDGTAVLRATSSTLAACTACHATYRQEVVDAATWQARTGSTHDPAAMHGSH